MPNNNYNNTYNMSIPIVSQDFIQGSFSDEHLATLEKDGIVCVPNFLTHEIIDELKDELSRIVAEEAKRRADGPPEEVAHFNAAKSDKMEHTANTYFQTSGDKIRFFLEEGQKEVSIATLNKVAHGFHCNDNNKFATFCKNKAFSDICKAAGRKTPTIVQTMYILKAPKIGGVVNPHQDSTWINTKPLSCMAIWFALDDCHVSNGCLLADKGSHKRNPLSANCELVDEKGGDSKIIGTLPTIDLKDMTPIECPKGSMVVFNGEVVHGSTDNRSDTKRHAFVMHFIDGECEWNKLNWMNPHVGMVAV
jgi:phytanoyl-CoA hydroxylase